MTARDADLVRKANRIAAFFAPYPEDEAAAGVARHLQAFWEPRMRRALADILARGGAGLDPLARRGAEAALARSQGS